MFIREELQEIRARAIALYEIYEDAFIEEALFDLAKAADALDALLARKGDN